MLAMHPNTSHHIQDVVTAIVRRFRVDVCTIYRYMDDPALLELLATHGLEHASVGYRMAVDQGLTGRVARTKRPLSVKDPAEHPDFHYVAGSGEERYRSFLGLPLLDFGTLLGVMAVQTVEPRMFLLSEIDEFYTAGKEVLDQLRAV